MKFERRFALPLQVIGLLLMIGLLGCSSEDEVANNNADQKQSGEAGDDSTLNVAYAAEPDTIDWMYTGATATRDVGWHIFETLFALDKDFKPRPMIAEDYEVNGDGTVYTIKLRENVTFHDDSTVTAEDVIASIERWRSVSSVGTIVNDYIEKITADGEDTIKIELNETYRTLIADMSAPKSALTIIPAEIAEEAGDQPLDPEQLIGTGPYKFEKWDRSDEIILSRFKDYAARDETDWGGLTGKKDAHFDKINFKIVKDPQVMINGLKTGLYDYAQTIPPDLYEMVEASPDMDAVTYMNGYTTIIPDKTEPPFDDLKVRRALNHALDKETIAKTAYGNENFYNFDGALFSPEQKELYSEKGTEQYLAYDPEKAKSLLEQSNYNGEQIQIIYSNDYERYDQIAQVAKQQLEQAGFKVKLVAYEWSTYLEKWGDPANWDLVVVGWSTRFSPNELGMLVLDDSSSGWYESEHWEELLKQWGNAESKGQKDEILAEMNQTIYDELPFIKVVNETTFDVKSEVISDYTSWVGQRFWNTSKNE